jgi:PhnB protein
MTVTPAVASLAPRLIVENVDEAIKFYEATIGAELIERYALPNGIVVHAALRLGPSTVSLAQRVDDWKLLSPDAIGGTPVLLRLEVDSPDAVASQMLKLGASVIIEIKDRPYGQREGRLRDPFGHLWLLTTTIEELTPAEIEKRLIP